MNIENTYTTRSHLNVCVFVLPDMFIFAFFHNASISRSPRPPSHHFSLLFDCPLLHPKSAKF